MEKVLLTPVVKPNLNSLIPPQDIIPPIERIRLFSSEEFEAFVTEWVCSCVGTGNKKVYNLGGAGDMGRDIIIEFDNKTYWYYQCKKYDNALAPSEIYVELAKICYYTYTKDIPHPQKYFFVSPYDVGPKLFNLLHNPNDLKKELIDNWDIHCKKKISQSTEIFLDPSLKAHVNAFDFSIFGCQPINDIISEYSKTIFFPFRFGLPIASQRPNDIPPPNTIQQNEIPYIIKAKRAYTLSNRLNPDLSIDDLPDNAKQFIGKQRYLFYAAESLKRYSFGIYKNDEQFSDLKREVLSNIQDTVEMYYDNPLTRLRSTLSKAASANTASNILDYMFHAVKTDDRRGICHHLANEDIISWENNND